ncbi:MAG: DUF4870 domain-containing protein [Gammaproteobacteria bacterium]|nr:DUF4870 domain-containing protein [Gammaproteobacteria bacterium]
MQNNDKKERQYMALAPLASLAGIFINPLASTISPLILFFIFRNKRPQVGKVALQTADLAFSIQLWIVLTSLSLMLGISLDFVTAEDARHMMNLATSVILLIFVISLFFALYQAVIGKTCKHIISFRIAERVFNLIDKKKIQKDNT